MVVADFMSAFINKKRNLKLSTTDGDLIFQTSHLFSL